MLINSNLASLAEPLASMSPQDFEAKFAEIFPPEIFMIDNTDVSTTELNKIFDSSVQGLYKLKLYLKENTAKLSLFTKDPVDFNINTGDQLTGKNEYIVILHETATLSDLESIKSVLQKLEGNVQNEYQFALKGFNVSFPENKIPLEILRRLKLIKDIERNAIASKPETPNDEKKSWSVMEVFGFVFLGVILIATIFGVSRYVSRRYNGTKTVVKEQPQALPQNA